MEQDSVLTDWQPRVDRLAAAGTPFFLLTDFEGQRVRLYTLGETDADGLQFSFPGGGSQDTSRPVCAPTIASLGVRFSTYRRAFLMVQQGLQRGDSFLTNLTFPVPVTLTGSLEDVYNVASAKYRILLPGSFVCFSPETFVTISASGVIRTSPMKGTVLDTPGARDRLLADPKEVAEHATVVDLLRNDLSQVARNVRVERYRYVTSLETRQGGLLQTSTDIAGELPGDWRKQLGETLGRLLPAGSVSGAPKPATVRLIQKAEGRTRGFYCGVAGYFDGRCFDSCVMIRFLRQERDKVYFHSGGGITATSHVRPEYQELLAKIRVPGR